MDIIERLWIAHGELPGRQLLMRDAIAEIQDLRARLNDFTDPKTPGMVSIGLLNTESETCNRIRSDNDQLRTQVLDLENRCRSYANKALEIKELRELLQAIVDWPDLPMKGCDCQQCKAFTKARAFLADAEHMWDDIYYEDDSALTPQETKEGNSPND